jgi:transposase-like protein
MYSREERMMAIELYIKYDKSATAVVHELGYPSLNLLPRWYKAYLKEQETGVIRINIHEVLNIRRNKRPPL